MEGHALIGFRAKIDRAIEQLQALQRELTTFGQQPNPYAMHVHADREGGQYVFEIYPAWDPGTAPRWGVIVGEIVHDLRSGLDHLVRDLVVFFDGKHSREHFFPIVTEEPSGGFSAWATRTWRKQGHEHHGPLFGLPDAAVAVIEHCQPYHGADQRTLRLLHGLWSTDKHRHLTPMFLLSRSPTLDLRDVRLIERLPDRYERGAQIVEVRVENVGPNPHVDVQAGAPFDIAFAEHVPVVGELLACTQFILTNLLTPFFLSATVS